MKKVWLVLVLSFLFVVVASIVVFSQDYIDDDEHRYFGNNWSTPVEIYDNNSNLRLSGSYNITTTGFWIWQKTNYTGTANGTAYYSRVYIAVTLWKDADWTYTSSTTINNGSCSASHTLNVTPTKAQFYFRDGEYDYTPTYDTFSIIVSQG